MQTPFGWGTVAIDYDNDADDDIVYHGSVDVFTLIIADNPGVVLTNDGDCTAHFSYDAGALTRDHQVRTVQGVASGDLNGDGFQDIVSVSNFDFVRHFFLPFVGVFFPPTGSPFDSDLGLRDRHQQPAPTRASRPTSTRPSTRVACRWRSTAPTTATTGPR